MALLFFSSVALLQLLRTPAPLVSPELARQTAKEARYNKLLPKLTMRKPMYDNIAMHAPDGRFVCTVSIKKAKWYLKKNIATTPDPEGGLVRINLKFEPNKEETENKTPEQIKFQQRIKENKCVACGDSSGSYMRHYIIPSVLRHNFPKEYKSHLSHDIVILCPKCNLHVGSETGRRLTGMERAVLFKQPRIARDQYDIDRYLQQVHHAAVAIEKHGKKMPPEKAKRHRLLLREHFDTAELSAEQIRYASDIDFRVENPHYVAPAELIVNELRSPEELTSFIREWRRFFVKTADPKHMPPGWSVDSSVTNRGMEDLRGGVVEKRNTDALGRDINNT
jgi:hypothetical protein